MRPRILAAVGGIVVIVAVVFATSNSFVHDLNPVVPSGRSSPEDKTGSISANKPPMPKVQMVAAENFWGSLASQLGGVHAQVSNIVSDPNADPHEYEVNTADAQAIADANYVIVNGAGYDDWATKIIETTNNQNQKVLNVAKLLGKTEGDNPHFWYSPVYVNRTVAQMYSDLVSIDPKNADYYKQRYANLNSSLGEYNHRVNEIRQQFSGTRVGATEDIFVYLANATGLDIISPPDFSTAVAGGIDPPAQSVVQFQRQIQNGNISLLVYNAQTVTPITESIKALATKKGMPIVGITETIQPSGLSFQDWMDAELGALQNALKAESAR